MEMFDPIDEALMRPSSMRAMLRDGPARAGTRKALPTKAQLARKAKRKAQRAARKRQRRA